MFWAGKTSEFSTSVWLFDNPVEPGDGWLSLEGAAPDRRALGDIGRKSMDNVVLTNVISSILHQSDDDNQFMRSSEFIVGELDRVARLAGIEPVGPVAAHILSAILSRSLRLAQKVYDFSVPGRTLAETVAPSITIEQTYSKAIRSARQDSERMLPVQTFARTPGMMRARLIAPWSDIASEVNRTILPTGKWQVTRATVGELESLGEIESFATVVSIKAVKSTMPDIVASAIPALAAGKSVWMPAEIAAWVSTVCAIDVDEAKRSEGAIKWECDESIALPELGKIANCTVSADVVYGAHIDAIWSGLAQDSGNTAVRWWLMWVVRKWMLYGAEVMQRAGVTVTDIGMGSIGVAVEESSLDILTAAAVKAGLVYQHRGISRPALHTPESITPNGRASSPDSVHISQIRAASGAAYPAVASELDRSNELQTDGERKKVVKQIIEDIQNDADDYTLE